MEYLQFSLLTENDFDEIVFNAGGVMWCLIRYGLSQLKV